MKALILIFFLSFSAAGAAPRPDSRNFSCSDLTAIVQQNGSVIFTYGDHLFSRFVASGAYCDSGEVPLIARIPSLDNPQCQVGYVCINRGR